MMSDESVTNTETTNETQDQNQETQEQGQESGEETFDSKAIFDAEVEALTKTEASDKSATEANLVNPDGSFRKGAEEGDEAETEGDDDQGGEAEASAEEAGSEEEQGEQEEVKPTKKPRNDWKKEALESRKTLETLQAQVAELSTKVNGSEENVTEPDPVLKDFAPGEVDITKMDLPQETKDLLEFTPGLTKLISYIAAEQSRSFVEKLESERQVKQTEEATSKEADAKEESFWTSMEEWFSGEYPELSLSDIRESPDFNDWLKYRGTWVDAQLSGVSRYETSGAQEVYKRYIKEEGLAEPADDTESESNARKLASARTPSMRRKSKPPQKSNGNVFEDEVARIKSQQQHRRQFV